ncbi:MAG: pentapeptide repeat-containing protein [Lachnospiraceae bacterium]|nr:pentapeptide repeat-containing protein [Lachnospiraceae bacterium]
MQGTDLERKGKELATELDCYVREHFEELVEKFVTCFTNYCNQIAEMQKQGKKGKIAYIHFSVLRTNILLGKHELRLDAYDENWYMDAVECSYHYDVGEIYTYLERYREAVLEVWHQSHGINDLSDAYRKVYDESNIYLFYMAELIRMGMKRMSHVEAFLAVEKAECFIVGIGGYMDRFDILYKEDHTEKDSGEVKRFLQSGQQKLFSHEICERLDLSRGNYEDLEFQYSSFAECNFSQSNLSKSRFLFCNLKNTLFKDVKMKQVKLFDVDFSGANLENVDFSGAKLKCISFERAKLKNVDFSNAIIAEEINFRDASMIDCVLPEGR